MILCILTVLVILISRTVVSALIYSRHLENKGSLLNSWILCLMQLSYLVLFTVLVRGTAFHRYMMGRFDAYLRRMFNYGCCQQLLT